MKIKGLIAGAISAFALSNTAFGAPAQKQPVIAEKTQAPVLVAKENESQMIRSCPTYGPGYFYVPGTTTCLRLSGYVRSKAFDEVMLDSKSSKETNRTLGGLSWNTRGSFTLQSASATKLGTLRSYLQVRQDWSVGGTFLEAKTGDNAELHFAYVELGGLRFGLDEPIFAHWTGYYGTVLNDDLLTPVARSRTNVLSYTYTHGNGFSAILGAEQGSPMGINKGYLYIADASGVLKPEEHALSGITRSYIPNVVFGAKYMQGWGGVSAVAAYDSYFKTLAAKARIDANIDSATVWGMIGLKGTHDFFSQAVPSGPGETPSLIISRIAPSVYGDWFGSWAAWLGGAYQINESLATNIQFSMDEKTDVSAALSLDYAITPDFIVTPEIAYVKYDDFALKDPKTGTPHYFWDKANRSAVTLTLQLTRSF